PVESLYKQFGNRAARNHGVLVLSKIGRLAVHWRRPLQGTPKTAVTTNQTAARCSGLECAVTQLSRLVRGAGRLLLPDTEISPAAVFISLRNGASQLRQVHGLARTITAKHGSAAMERLQALGRRRGHVLLAGLLIALGSNEALRRMLTSGLRVAVL